MGVALGLLTVTVLVGPVMVKPIEKNIEAFFLVVGMLAAAISGQFDRKLVHAAATEPIALTVAVLIFGFVARALRPTLDRAMERATKIVSPRLIYFGLIVALGLLSSVITAVIAALVLVEAIAMLGLDRKSEIAAVVLACFSIGLGAALTPVGEPLGTIAIAALGADFWYLARLIGPIVIAGILVVGALSFLVPTHRGGSLKAERPEETALDIATRAGKVYIFCAGLVGLSWGLRPMVDEYISRIPQAALFWLNSISAIVDNATLTAAEIGPSLSHSQQRGILMGLLISGGMLIPGNIPNIVAASRLGISSSEWAKVGLAAGVPLMAICFVVLYLAG
jgi:predicted cation transporter